MASVTKRGNMWSVRYRVYDALGKESMKRVSGFHTKEEAWEAARKLEVASNAGIDVHGDRATCGEIMERWFQEHAILSVAKTTAARYSNAMDVLSSLPIYNMPVRKLSATGFSQFLVSLQEREPGRAISARTAMSYSEPLRFALAWAAENGMLPRNPIAGFKPLPVPKRPQRILSEDDITELVNTARGKPIFIALLLALYGGLRREECAGLIWSNINLPRRTVTITAAVARSVTGERIEKDVKTMSSMRTVSIPEFLAEELRLCRRLSDYVCVTPSGKPYALDSYRQALRRVVDEVNARREIEGHAPIPPITFHDLRHTHAAMLIKLGVQPKVIQERLGHASIKITMDLYGYLMTGLQESVADELDLQFRKQSSGHKSGHTPLEAV